MLRNLVSPAKPATKTFKDLVDVLKKHLNPTPILIAERYKFYKRNQKVGEKLSDYLAELRRFSWGRDPRQIRVWDE